MSILFNKQFFYFFLLQSGILPLIFADSCKDATHIHTRSHINYTKQTSHAPFSNYTISKAAKHTPHSETKRQHHAQFKTGVPQGAVLSHTLLNIYTSDTPTPRAPVKLTTYADEITIPSTHNNINIAKANIPSYQQEIIHGQTISFSTLTKQHALSSHQTQRNTAHNLH